MGGHSSKRAWLAGVLCGLVSVAGAAPAAGQSPAIEFEPSLKMTVGAPLEGFDGRGARLDASLRLDVPDGQSPPIVTAGRLLLPRGVAFNGRRYAKCSGQLMRESQSTALCPKTSVMGGGNRGFIEDPTGLTTIPQVVFVNGGARRIWGFTTLYNPALVQEPIPFELRELGRRKRSFEVRFDVPQIMRVVAGVPVALTYWPFVVGGRPYALGYVTFDRRCPRGGGLHFTASLTYLRTDGSSAEVTRRAPVACHSGRGPTQ